MFDTLFFTLYSCVVTVGSLFFVGLPLAAMLAPKHKSLPETAWVIAPFLGLACIVLVLQNLIYLGVPIAKSFFSIWILGAFLWLGVFKSGLLKKLLPIPYLLLLLAIFVYLIHGLGLLYLGPHFYVGYGWYDQLNYVSITQFLIDHSLTHTSLQDVINQPSAIKAMSLMPIDRIGAEVFQGFMACSLFADAKTAFEPVILLLPFLMVLVIYEISLRFSLSKNIALMIAVFAAFMPSIATIHLQCYLSQALIAPLLLLWPVILSDLFTTKGLKEMITAVLVLAVAASVYLEFYLVFLVLAFVYAFLISVRRKTLWEFVILLSVIIAALGLNIGFLNHYFEVGSHAIQAHGWKRMYPWLDFINALNWLWLGALALLLKSSWKFIIDSAAILFFVMSYLGFAVVAFKKRSLVCLIFLILALLPVGIYLLNFNSYAYHFFKALLTVSALLPLGIVLAFRSSIKNSYPVIVYIIPITAGLVIITSTLLMITASTRPELLAKINQGVGHKILSADSRAVQIELEKISGKNLLIAWHEPYRNGDFVNGWLSYYARDNKIWLANSLVGDKDLKEYLAKIDTLPPQFLLLTSSSQPLFPLSLKTKQKIWGNQTYSLWQLSR